MVAYRVIGDLLVFNRLQRRSSSLYILFGRVFIAI